MRRHALPDFFSPGEMPNIQLMLSRIPGFVSQSLHSCLHAGCDLNLRSLSFI
ncbi:hypothetical protein CFter6_5249 [Collimonas fungivorans]|uniref:Uncharacterized protein n=1 Tax=Collimonas fungivorans TaxID=158899 RepID=A0A127PJ27_9BURK|nr:hypothetical protein CFter6_5249 [Collimonas fungivorans]